MNPVATIRQLARFPVKSMRGEALAAATLSLQGIPEDRRYAFVQAESRSSFPWLTARQLPEMLRYTPSIEKPGSVDQTVAVTTPSGEKWPVDSEELRRALEASSGRAVFLLRDYRGSYDVANISLISRQTIAQIAQESGTQENPWRFRPNLLVELEGGGGYEELNWVGRVLRVGETARIAITEVDERCMMITLDPDTAQPNPAVLRCVVQQHQKRAGVYATVIAPGEVRAGDPVWLD
jgi:hypothetical protein